MKRVIKAAGNITEQTGGWIDMDTNQCVVKTVYVCSDKRSFADWDEALNYEIQLLKRKE